MPKPFSRPSIDLGGEKKAWVNVVPTLLKPGDLVQDYGLIVSIDYPHTDTGFTIVNFASGRSVTFSRDLVRAFIAVGS